MRAENVNAQHQNDLIIIAYTIFQKWMLIGVKAVWAVKSIRNIHSIYSINWSIFKYRSIGTITPFSASNQWVATNVYRSKMRQRRGYDDEQSDWCEHLIIEDRYIDLYDRN